MATTTSSARKPTRTDPTTTEIPPERILNYYYRSWRKGRASDPGPPFYLYSPKCAEGEFSEVHIQKAA